jgi:DAK2 domain fusion protein YloV
VVIERIDAKTIKNMFISGAKLLESKKKYVDELNVFPVPDGDTGTNMTLTILAAAKEVSNVEDADIKKVAKAMSSGSLRGARGNSGVILSQLFRGFAKEISLHDELDTVILANAMERGVETAYKAVMKPKEGTILTVAKAAAEKATELAVDSDDILFVLKESIKYAEEVLSQTPDMLPVLKQAGVVDAGGQGLVYVLKGAYIYLSEGEDADILLEEETSNVPVNVVTDNTQGEIEFGYCTEFIINVFDENESENNAIELRNYLQTIGDCVVAVADDDIIKIHVHTNNPGKALQKGLSLGELVNIKIDNMRQQHNSIMFPEEKDNSKQQENNLELQEEKENGFIAVSIGEGLTDILKKLGADYIVEGGQTMNPSTEDLINAIEQVNAKNIFILPNNKNIILAANQCVELVQDKNVFVIPTVSIPQGITAMINFNQGQSLDANVSNMIESIEDVSTGQITFAVRDTSIDDKSINEGDILGIGNGKILVVEKELEKTAKELAEQLINEESELITLYYGKEIIKEDADKLAEFIEDKYDNCDVEVHYGGQPLYYYIMSVE